MNASAAGWHETGLAFDCAGERLAGVLARPAAGQAACDVGVVVVVGGPQYRAGSHRLFVRLARALAADGVPTLRFDVRGMGDSTGTPAGFEALDDDIAAAIDSLQAACPTVRRVVLWGLCDGASAALLYVQRAHDARVAALCLLNPWARTEHTLARARVRHYYLQRLVQPAFWRKLVVGRVAWSGLSELAAHLRTATGASPADPLVSEPGYAVSMMRVLAAWRGPLLIALSGRDYTAREFEELLARHPAARQGLDSAGAGWRRYPSADHTFSDRAESEALVADCQLWLAGLAGPSLPAAAASPSARISISPTSDAPAARPQPAPSSS